MRQRPALALVTLCFGLAACGDRPAEIATTSDAPAATAPTAGAGAPPLTSAHRSASGTGSLPAGHPPLAAGDGMPAATSAGSGDLAWTPASGWIEETPSSGMRRAQYRIPGPGGDGELVVFRFAGGEGGDPMANAQRWASQFRNAAGQPATDALRTSQQEVNGLAVMRVEVAGTYDGGMAMTGAAKKLDDYKLLGAIAQSPGGNWFFKLTGPAATVEAQRDAFDAFVGSLRAGA